MADERNLEIINELKMNFLNDKKSIQDKIVEIEVQIKQCNDFIENLSKKENNDYNIFSPRSASRVYKDQASEKKLQIEKLEIELRDLYKQLGNVTKKLDNLDELDPTTIKADVTENSNSKLLKLQEDDRQRIAADLHDSVLQNLTLVMQNFELAGKFIDYDPIRAKLELETNRKLVKDTIDEIRSTIFDLRPMQFSDFGFKKTVENLISDLSARTTMSIEANIEDLDDLEQIYLLTIFRILQELVTNSIKHSKGTLIDIIVNRRENDIYINVNDNGVGFTVSSEVLDNHFGLKILKERVSILNGTINYESDNKGTKFTVIIPIEENR